MPKHKVKIRFRHIWTVYVVDEIHRLLDAGDIEEARDTYAELVGAYSGRTEHPRTGETRP